MDHLAILKKSHRILDKILTGEKTIESRWYKTRRAPWGRINKGDLVYFKNSGEDVSVVAKVSKVEEYEVGPAEIYTLLEKHFSQLGVGMEYYETIKNQKYCILVHLEKVCFVNPFPVDKTGYGNMSAWISLPDIRQIRK